MSLNKLDDALDRFLRWAFPFAPFAIVIGFAILLAVILVASR